ncbi:MAG: hypothetical protein JSS24_13780, partial [Proteobacteria bacterium]|nr:hypothetical protein [Pseudomonadota bacterium]
MTRTRMMGLGLMLGWAVCGAAAGVAAPAPASAATQATLAATPPKREPLRIQVFSPQGRIKGVRQVSVRFSTPVVVLGDPRLPDPFRVECAAKGQGRWA